VTCKECDYSEQLNSAYVICCADEECPLRRIISAVLVQIVVRSCVFVGMFERLNLRSEKQR